MKRRNLSLGLAILLTALILVQGAMAYPTQENACTGCHSTSASLSISATGPAIVTPGQSFDVSITWSGGVAGKTAVKWPSVNNNALFGLDPAVVVSSNASGTATSTLTAPLNESNYQVAVYVATKSGGPITNFAIIPIEVKAANQPKNLTSVTISPLNPTVVIGNTKQFTATTLDQNNDLIGAVVTWNSSNSAIGTIDINNGLFTAVGTGAATITVTAVNGSITKTNSTTVTVEANQPKNLTSVTISPLNPTVVAGNTKQFIATTLDQNNDLIGAVVTWNSSNTSVGIINSAGLFTANNTGTATITVTAVNGSITKTNSTTVTVTASTPSDYYIVTFIVTDNVTGKPIKDAKVSIDGVKKETNRSGIVVFKKVSPGNHNYTIKAEHYTKIKGSIEVGANMTVSVKLVPKEKHEEKDDDEHHDKKNDSDKKHEDKIKENKNKDKETDKEDDD